MGLFDRKAEEVETLICELFDEIQSILGLLQQTIQDYIKDDKQFKSDSFEIHKKEHKADKIRRKIGRALYDGAFLPIYREDYFLMIEMVDKIANQSEHIGDFITLTRPPVPEFLRQAMVQLVDLNVESFGLLRALLADFIAGKDTLYMHSKTIRGKEKEVDLMQFDMTRSVFKSDLNKVDKFHIKKLIDKISLLSDKVEDVSDRLEIIASKRRF